MHKGWLKKQLTNAKQNAPLWAELADAIQEVVDQHAMPLIARLRNIKSSFTMAEADIDKKIGELGRFFAIRSVPAEVKPIVFMQRLDEIHLKDTVFPLVNTLWREFDGIAVTWEPLYAPVDLKQHPYGSLLLTKEDVTRCKGRYGDMFLTSRGVVRLPVNEIMREHDFQDLDKVIEHLTKEIRVYVEPLLPLHIVFDGHQLELKYTIKEADEWFYAVSETIGQDTAINLSEGLEAFFITRDDITSGSNAIHLGGVVGHQDYILRFDAIPTDAWTLDSNFLPFYFEDVMEFYTVDRSKTHIRITGEHEADPAIVTKEANDYLNKTSFHQGKPPRLNLVERVEHMISVATGGQEELVVADKKEVFSRLNDELRNLIGQREAEEGIALTTTELEDVITEVNRQIAHAGYELRFDVTPLDQCMLDSGHFEP